MRYITRDGQAFGLPSTGRKIKPVILVCIVGTGFGIALRILIDMHPGIIKGLISGWHVFEMLVLQVCSDLADACGDLIEFLKQQGYGKR